MLASGSGASAGAQSRRPIQVELALSGARLMAFDDETDLGAGLRVGYHVAHAFTVEAELEHYPRGLGRPTFSLFTTAGTGLVRFSAAPRPLACIAVFPPPLECQLASGRTLLALGFGAALVAQATERVVLRLDLEDRLLRYPEPAFLRERSWDQNPRFAVALGLRF